MVGKHGKKDQGKKEPIPEPVKVEKSVEKKVASSA